MARADALGAELRRAQRVTRESGEELQALVDNTRNRRDVLDLEIDLDTILDALEKVAEKLGEA